MVKIKDKTHFSSLPAAKNRAVAVKEKLKSENPILALYNSNKSYSIAEEIIHPPHILKFKLPRDKNENYPNNPDDHIKPLDIVWIEKEKLDVRFFHVGVYLGNNKVCHVTGSPFNGREGTKITG